MRVFQLNKMFSDNKKRQKMWVVVGISNYFALSPTNVLLMQDAVCVFFP